MMLRHYLLARDPTRPRLRTRTDERMKLYDRTLSVSLLASAMKAGRPRGPGPLRFTRTQAPRQACHVRKKHHHQHPSKTQVYAFTQNVA